MDQIGRQRSARQPPHHATRMCVGCRARDDRSALLRVVAVVRGDGRPAVAVDQRARLPGRGAWLHPTRECLDLAVRRHAFPRALRVPGPLDVVELTEWVGSRGSAQDEQDSTTRSEHDEH